MTGGECDADGEKEGTKIIKVTAQDKVGNIGSTGVRQVMFFVDETPPNVEAWHIDRLIGGITYKLWSDTYDEQKGEDLAGWQVLQGLYENRDDPGNKDAFQNVAFELRGTVSDTMGVNTVRLCLEELQFDESGRPKTKTQAVLDENGQATSETETVLDLKRIITIPQDGWLPIGDGDSKYNPVYKLNHARLTKWDESLATGMHYIRATIYANDVVIKENEDPLVREAGQNETGDIEVGWFAWWPESDNPRVGLADSRAFSVKDGQRVVDEFGRNTATFSIKNTFLVNTFDDDLLQESYVGLLSDEEYNSLPLTAAAAGGLTPSAGASYIDWDTLINNIENYSYEEESEKGGLRMLKRTISVNKEREKPISCSSGDTSGQKHLVAYSVGGGDNFLTNDDGDDIVPTGRYDINIKVVDENAPILFIETPQNAAIPSVTMGAGNQSAKFHFKGQTLDTQGCGTVDFVWVPDSLTKSTTEKARYAQAWLYSKTLDGVVYTNKHKTEAPPSYGGMKMWSVKIADLGGVAGTGPNNSDGSTLLGEAKADSSSNGWKTQEFDFQVDLFSEFHPAGKADEKNDGKFFAILASRVTTGNKEPVSTYSEHTLSADTTNPMIVMTSPDSDGAIYSTSDVNGLDVEFYAYKHSGMAIKSVTGYILDKDKNKIELGSGIFGYAAKGTGTSGTVEGTSIPYTTVKFNIPQTKVGDITQKASGTLIGDAGVIPVFHVDAEDILGNKSQMERSIAFDGETYLKSITSNHPNGTTFGIDKTIEFVASFSGSVNIKDSDKASVTLPLGGVTSKGVSKQAFATVRKIAGNLITFGYTVAEEDMSTGVTIAATDGLSPFENGDKITSGKAVQYTKFLKKNVVTDSTCSKRKTFKINGIRPHFNTITVTANGVTGSDSKVYCTLGKEIRAKLTLDKKCYITGSPTLRLKVQDPDPTAMKRVLLLPLESSKNEEVSGQVITSVTFSKAITSVEPATEISDPKKTPQGEVFVDTTSLDWMSEDDFGLVVDEYNNSAVDPHVIDKTSDTIIIDTVAPKAPVITYKDGATDITSTLSTTAVNAFRTAITAEVAGKEVTKPGALAPTLWISDNGGVSYSEYTSAKTINGEMQLCAKASDTAGNESAPTLVTKFDVINGFPPIDVECLSNEGNYKAGSKIKFRATFGRAITGEKANATLLVHTNGDGSKCIATCASNKSDGVKQLDFEYTVANTDEYTVDIGAGAITLTDFADSYGNAWASTDKNARYTNNKVRLDGVSPKVTKIEHVTSGTGGANSTVVKITFNEEVSRGVGKVTLQQKAGWVIPTVLSTEDFDKIYKNADEDKKKFLIQKENGVVLVDNELDPSDGVKNPGMKYHGTGRGLGPYVMTTQGLVQQGSAWIPDTTGKYVLRFEFDPAEIDPEKKVNCQQTFESNRKGINIGTSDVRSALESAGFNKRTIEAANKNIVITQATDANGAKISILTITFGESLTGEVLLEKGRKWEINIDNGAFTDLCGNGYAGEQTALVTNEFMSGGVETPVIRVDRYSYSIGINQPSNINDWTKLENTGGTDGETLGIGLSDSQKLRYKQGSSGPMKKPTGLVRVRVDNFTPGATISYTSERINATNYNGTSRHSQSGNGDLYYKHTGDKTGDYFSAGSCTTNYTTPFVLAGCASNVMSDRDTAAGIESSKMYIGAVAKLNSTTSEVGKEGAFCTVLLARGAKENGYYEEPYGAYAFYGKSKGKAVSGFPLNWQGVGCAELKRAWKDPRYEDFYWVSYEVVCDGLFGMRGGDWSRLEQGLDFFYGDYAYVFYPTTWYHWW